MENLKGKRRIITELQKHWSSEGHFESKSRNNNLSEGFLSNYKSYTRTDETRNTQF
jgi:hypothetical protein